MKWTYFILSLGVGFLLSGLALVLDCSACDKDATIAVAGMCGYGALLTLAIWRGPSRPVFAGAFLAFGIHVFLFLRMASGIWCWICAAAAFNALILAGLTIAQDRGNLKLAGFVLPWSAAVLLVLPRPADSIAGITSPQPVIDGATILVLERPSCEYCIELRSTHLPRIEKEFGGRVSVRYRSADDVPGVSKTPTIVVQSNHYSRVIEGLPPYDMLRNSVQRALEVHP